MQYWLSRWIKDNKKMTEGEAIKYNRARRYLGISLDATID